nr:MbcA/ParS/Xre antitoxin family protein [uncultured Lichenicoccus sp.]
MYPPVTARPPAASRTNEALDPVSLAEPVTQPEAEAMLRAAFNLFMRWQLDAQQSRRLLGSPSERTYQRWKAGDVATIPHDTICRLGDLMGIHKALRYLFTDAQRGYDWIHKQSPAFGGFSALDRMLQGAPTDLAAIRAYLDAERASW